MKLNHERWATLIAALLWVGTVCLVVIEGLAGL